MNMKINMKTKINTIMEICKNIINMMKNKNIWKVMGSNHGKDHNKFIKKSNSMLWMKIIVVLFLVKIVCKIKV